MGKERKVVKREDLFNLDHRVRTRLGSVHLRCEQIIRDYFHFEEMKSSEVRGIATGSINDINNVAQSLYYRYLPALIEELQPKQIVELGGAMGASAIMMLSALPKGSTLYSVTLPEYGLEFAFLTREYPGLVKVVGNDLDLSTWPHDLHLSKTDLWFFDSEHSYGQLSKEIRLYAPFFKEGTIALFDDIRLDEDMQRAWLEIELPKISLPDLHHSGFGMVGT